MAYGNSRKNFGRLKDYTSASSLPDSYKWWSEDTEQETFAIVFLHIYFLLLKTADKTFQYVNKGSQQLPVQ